MLEKSNTGKIHVARFISVSPRLLKDLATRMEFEVQDAGKFNKKIMFHLTDDIVLFHDPASEKIVDTLRRPSADTESSLNLHRAQAE